MDISREIKKQSTFLIRWSASLAWWKCFHHVALEVYFYCLFSNSTVCAWVRLKCRQGGWLSVLLGACNSCETWRELRDSMYGALAMTDQM